MSMPPPGAQFTTSRAEKHAREPNNEEESSSAKRSRSSRHHSHHSRSFSARVKEELTQIYERGVCWACRAHTRIERAHVVPREDPQLSDLSDLGLLNLESYGDLHNAIPLCSNCHDAFDNRYKPKLVVVPAYLDYFFDKERVWQERFTTIPESRLPPTAETYFEHCVQMDPQTGIPNATRGGVYMCYVDQNYMAEGWPGPFVYERNWHGDPMAMLYRAIQAAERIVWSGNMPVEVKDDLMELHVLYEKGNKLQRQLFRAGSGPFPAPSAPTAQVGSTGRAGPSFPPPSTGQGSSQNPDNSQDASQGPHQQGSQIVYHNPAAPSLPPSPPPTASPNTEKKRCRESSEDADVSASLPPKKHMRLDADYGVRVVEAMDQHLASNDEFPMLHVYLAQITASAPPHSEDDESKIPKEGPEMPDPYSSDYTSQPDIHFDTCGRGTSTLYHRAHSSASSDKDADLHVRRRRGRIWRYGPWYSAEDAVERKRAILG